MILLFYASVGLVAIVLICWLILLRRDHARRMERQAKMLRTLRSSEISTRDWAAPAIPGTDRA